MPVPLTWRGFAAPSSPASAGEGVTELHSLGANLAFHPDAVAVRSTRPLCRWAIEHVKNKYGGILASTDHERQTRLGAA